jgi:hypothetical protein
VPRYFSFGADDVVVIDIKIQMSILRFVTGEDTHLDAVTASQRSSLWKGWYLKYPPRESRQFILNHLPDVARQHGHVWGLRAGVEDEVIGESTLVFIRDQIRDLINCSNQAPVAQVRIRNKTDRPAEDKEDDLQPSPPKRTRQGPHSLLSSPQALPSSLKISELKETRVNELAAIEHCLWLLVSQQGLPLSQVALEESADSLGLSVEAKQLTPTTISLAESNDLMPSQASRAMSNVKSARASLLNAIVDKLGNLFLPNEDDLLVQWTSDGARYSDGERLPAVNYGTHQANDQRFLTDEAVHCIRHLGKCRRFR